MNIAVVTTGDEVLSGNIVDSNSAWISDKCWLLGHKVSWHLSVGDDLDAIGDALKLAEERAEVVFVTGGLGATADDITLEAAAKAFDKKMVLNEDVWAGIEAFFKRVGRECTENNKKQAHIPEGGKALANTVGTAPGVQIKLGKAIFFFLAGVPKEMMQVFNDSIFPWLKERSSGTAYGQKFLECFGIPEASFDQRIKDIDLSEIRLSYRVAFPTTRLKLVARGKSEAEVKKILSGAEAKIKGVLGHYIYGADGEKLESVVGSLLRGSSSTLAVAESCTGGMIANRITDISGASQYFERGLVTYSNRSKQELLGVREETLKTHGAVSKETAIEMAEGVRKVTGATFGLAVTGIAGPLGGTPEKPVGTVHIALATPSGTIHNEYHYHRDREWFKSLVTATAIDTLRKHLLKV